jgi:Winged helix DNA-binding domain
MTSDALSTQALNRALLARQRLLARSPLPSGGDRAGHVIRLVEHLAGLQAQAPFPPYYGLWSRLDGFRPEDLSDLITGRQVVRIALMRGTIHLVSARDCLMFRPLLRPVLERGLRALLARQLTGVDTRALATAGRALVEEKPRSFSELGELLSATWPDHPPASLAQGVRALVPLVQVPPRAVWGRAGQSLHTSAESWLGRPLHDTPSLDDLFERYLAAFGPASVADAQAWSGLTRLREVAERLRPRLRTFRDPAGAELFDLPDAPRPSPDTEAPVRLVAEFDNLILSHADRSRIISDAARKRLFTRNGIFPGTVLAGGFVAGMWRISRSRDIATLVVELFGALSAADRDALEAEGERLLSFAAADAGTRDIRYAPVALRLSAASGMSGCSAVRWRLNPLSRGHVECEGAPTGAVTAPDVEAAA